MTWRVGLSAAIAFPLVLASSTSAAIPTRVQLAVDDAEGCLSAATLARDIDALLGRSATDLAPAAIRSKLRVTRRHTRAPDTYRASLVLETADGRVVGTRDLERVAPSCGTLDGPTAVVAALLVDAAEDTIRLKLPPVPTTPERDRAWRLESELAGTVLAGLVPPAPGVRLDTRTTPPGFVPILARADLFPSATPSRSGPTGAFLAVAGTLGLCPEHRGSRFGADACAGVWAGIVRASGEDVPMSVTRTSPVVLAVGEGGASLQLTGGISVRVSGAVAWGRQPADWHLASPAGPEVVVWKPWPVTLLGSFGLVVETSSENGTPSRH